MHTGYGGWEEQDNMESLSEKIYIELEPPTEEDARSDQRRLLDGLKERYGEVELPLPLLRQLYPLCRKAEWHLTVTLVWDGTRWQVTGLEPGDTTAWHYGLAADLGSTSVTMELVDLNSGTVVAKESMYNRQTALGSDVLTRIFYAKDQPEHLEELRLAAVETINELMDHLSEASGVDVSRCPVLVLAGNTVMTHFLLGLDGFPLFLSPYAPVAAEPGFQTGAALGLHLDGLVYLYPSRANYMGGDIISGVVATGIAQSEGIRLFFDIGTNGELVAGCRDFLLAGAGAAGPALEGGVIRTGMCAGPGAVEQVDIRGEQVTLRVIGGEKARGICGSGIVDLLAELFLEGIIDFRGTYQPEKSRRVVQAGEELAYCYAEGSETADGQPLLFYQSDIQEFLATKAAAYTMVEYMLKAIGMSFDDVEKFYVAGAFGTYIRTASAVTIGLYPDLPEEKVACVGNSSLEGARALLLDRRHLPEVNGILEKMDYIQYGAIPDFVDSMSAARAIPHLDTARYPSVMKWKAQRQSRA